jgi:hypothetical protein
MELLESGAMLTLFRTWIFPSLVLGLLLVACGKKPAQVSSVRTASITLGATPEPHGLLQANTTGDGRTVKARVGDEDCQQLIPKESRSDSYLYLQADTAFKNRSLPPLTVTVDYFDSGPMTFHLEYDSTIEGKNGGGYTRSKERIETKGLKEWQQAKFLLERPRFAGRQNDHADFRLRVGNADKVQFFVRSVTLSEN